MGKPLWLFQSRHLCFTTGELVLNMQSPSRTEPTQTALVRIRPEFPEENTFERKIIKGSLLKGPAMHAVRRAECDADCECDSPDVFEESVCSPRHLTTSVSRRHGAGKQSKSPETFRPNDLPRVSEQDSAEIIPPMPSIVVQGVPSEDESSRRLAVPLNSKTTHAVLPVDVLSRKSRTHSDSAIYESEQKKQCLRSALSGSRSLTSTPSNQSSGRNVSTIGSTEQSLSLSLGPMRARDVTGEEHVTSGTGGQKSRFLQPILWNLGGFDQFALAQERSPKLYWLRRHSDSNVAVEDQVVLQVECHTPRSQGIGDTIPEVEQGSVKQTTTTGSEESEKVPPRTRLPVEGCSSDGRKCQKVKKYLQTRYQNQSLDSDEVFMDASDSSPKWTSRDSSLPAEPSKPSRTELINRNDQPETTTYTSGVPPIELRNYSTSKTTEDFSAEIVKGQTVSNADDDFNDRTRVRNDPDTPAIRWLSPRQTVFDFSFPSGLREIPDCSGGVVFGLFRQNCFPTPFAHGPLPLESFVVSSSSPGGASGSSLLGNDDTAPNLVPGSKERQLGIVGPAGNTKRNSKKDESFSSKFAEPNSDLEKSACCASTSKLRQSSYSNSWTDDTKVLLRIADRNIELPSVTVGSPSVSSSATVISSLPSSQPLLPPASPSPSAVGTPTRSCPQVVFDFQFSEKIHEQRLAGDSASFVCPVCSSIFLSYNSLANHVVSHLPSEVITQDGSDSSKVHLCRVCNRSFSRSDMLSRHMRLHTGLRPYECHLCQQVFSRSDHLHTHLRTHTGEKPYRCTHCMYAAPRRDMVTRHMRIHARGAARRGRRSSSTSALTTEAGQTSDDNAVFESTSGRQTTTTHRPSLPVRGKGNSFQKRRNWSLTTAGTGDPQDPFEDLPRMTRTESTTSVDSGVSYLTPRSLVPSLWSPGVDSPDVFSRYPGHFLWPATGSEMKHDLEKSAVGFSNRDTDLEMNASFQKCQVTSPFEKTSPVNSDELLDQQREAEFV